MKKTLSILFVLTLAVCIGIASVAFASAPAVEISADVYYGDYTGERVDVEGKATIAFGTTVNVTSEEYGIVVATYGNEWSGTATELKYFAKSNESGKFGVAVYGLSDGFYGLKAYVYDKDTQAYTYSEDEVKICIGYSAVTLVRPEADDVVEYVKTGTAYADPSISGIDRWNTYDGTTYTTYDFSTVVNEDITLYGETLTYELSNTDPIVLYTDTSMSGASYTANEVDLPYLKVTSSLKGVQAQNAGWYPANGNPNVVIENGKIKATGKMSGKVVLKSGDTELDVTVKSPVLSAADLDALSLVTFYGDVVASSEYYGKAQAYLDGHYELINDIDYATYTRAKDTYAYSNLSKIQNSNATIDRIPEVGYMLPIASMAANKLRSYMTTYVSNAWGQGQGYGTAYSKTWLSILSDYVEEVVVDHAIPAESSDIGKGNTYKLYDMQVKAGVTQSGEAEAFVGINPKNRPFRGVLDGAGKTISNAWLMLDNYGITTVKNSADNTLAYGQMTHFIGVNEGTVQNLVFDNLGIGSALDYYGYTVTASINNEYMGTTMYALLGYSGVETNGKGLGAASSATPASTTNRKYYVTYDHNQAKGAYPISMQCYNASVRGAAKGNALIGLNAGKINNIVMNYRSSGTTFAGTGTVSNMTTDANGLCWINETAGSIDNVIVNRLGDHGLVVWNTYQAYTIARSTRNVSPTNSRFCVTPINKGSVNNTYVFNNQTVESAAGSGAGTFNITIVSTDGTNNVAGMDTTNCNTFIQNYVAGLNG